MVANFTYFIYMFRSIHFPAYFSHIASFSKSIISLSLSLSLYIYIYIYIYCPVDYVTRTHRLILCRGVRPPHNECPDATLNNLMLELWVMWSTLSLPLLPDLLWPGVVAPDRVLSMGQIEVNCVLMQNWIVWNRTAFWHWNCVLMLNSVGWNGTFLYAKLNCLK